MKIANASTRAPTPAELLDLAERAELYAYEAEARRSALGERLAQAIESSASASVVKEHYDALRAASRATARLTRISRRLKHELVERWGRR